MPKPAAKFDAESVRASWDDAADVYTAGQMSGRDYYRYEFFGPAQLALCGEVRGSNVLDVGCGNGYFAREMARRGARVTGIDISSDMIGHDRYFERGPLEYTWRGWGRDFTTEAMHATLEDWLGWILEAGFQLRALKEPCPTEQALQARSDLEDAARVPYYLFFDLVRPLTG